jgi:hypothetical protein
MGERTGWVVFLSLLDDFIVVVPLVRCVLHSACITLSCQREYTIG